MPTQDLAAPCACVGRTMSISVSNSQFLLDPEELLDDARGLAQPGHLIFRLVLIRGTEVKVKSFNSAGRGISFERLLQHIPLDF